MPRFDPHKTGIIFFRDDDDLDPLVFDATFESVREHTAEITSSPVEDDADVVDHRRQLPALYRFTSIFLVEDPDPLLVSARNVLSVGKDPADLPAGLSLDASRAFSLYYDLMTLHWDDVVFSVATDIEYFYKVMIESLMVSLIAHGQGIQVTGTLREVRFAATGHVPLPKEPVRTSKGKKTKGAQSGSQASDNLQAKGATAASVDFLAK